MLNNNKSNSLNGLYLITDSLLLPTDEQLLTKVEAALQGGASIVQYRDKSQHNKKRHRQATALVELCRSFDVPLIINDDIALAKTTKAAGVHLGQTDRSLNEARALLGTEALIGITCHASLNLAQIAKNQGADYIAYGAFFPSNTKPNATLAPLQLLRKSATQLNLPTVAIGGINRHNAAQLITAGANMLAVVEALLTADNIAQEAQQFCQLFSANLN